MHYHCEAESVPARTHLGTWQAEHFHDYAELESRLTFVGKCDRERYQRKGPDFSGPELVEAAGMLGLALRRSLGPRCALGPANRWRGWRPIDVHWTSMVEPGAGLLAPSTAVNKDKWPPRGHLSLLVEAAGIEPASASPTQTVLHT